MSTTMVTSASLLLIEPPHLSLFHFFMLQYCKIVAWGIAFLRTFETRSFFWISLKISFKKLMKDKHLNANSIYCIEALM